MSDFDRLLSQHKYLFNEYFLESIKQPAKPKIKKPIHVGGK